MQAMSRICQYGTLIPRKLARSTYGRGPEVPMQSKPRQSKPRRFPHDSSNGAEDQYGRWRAHGPFLAVVAAQMIAIVAMALYYNAQVTATGPAQISLGTTSATAKH